MWCQSAAAADGASRPQSEQRGGGSKRGTFRAAGAERVRVLQANSHPLQPTVKLSPKQTPLSAHHRSGAGQKVLQPHSRTRQHQEKPPEVPLDAHLPGHGSSAPPKKKLTCPRPMGLGEGSDQTNSVGCQREVLARAAVPVGHPPVQVQHVAQGWATCLPVGPVGPPCRWGLAEERLHQWEGENPRERWGRGRFVPTLCQAQLQGEQQHQEKQSPPRAPGAQGNHHSTRRRQPLRAGGTAATVPTGSGGASSPPRKDQQPGLQLLLGIHATMLGWGTPPGTAGLPPRCSNEMGRGTTTEAGLHRLEKGGLIHHHT